MLRFLGRTRFHSIAPDRPPSRGQKDRSYTRERDGRGTLERSACRRAAPGSDRRAPLEPGDRVGTEAELAQELDVAGPLFREAVRLLVARKPRLGAARGPGGGVFVARQPRRRPRADRQRRDRGHAREQADVDCRADRGATAARGAARRAWPPSTRTPRSVRVAARDRRGGARSRRRRRPARDRYALSPRRSPRPAGTASHPRSRPGPRGAAAALKELIAPAIVEAVARDQHRRDHRGDRAAQAGSRGARDARASALSRPICSRS